MEFNRRLRTFSDLYPSLYPGKATREVTFIVTHQCNLACSYCYEHHKGSGRMDWPTAKRCVDLLFREEARGGYLDSQRAHGLVLSFIGGEPLLEIDLIDRIMDYFRMRAMEKRHRWATNYMISMSSNGMDYFSPAVQRFLEKNRGRVALSITLDGDRQTHDSCRKDCNGCGSYSRAAAAFREIHQKFRQDGTKFTIAPENVGRVFVACKDMIERFALRSLFCNCVYEQGWTTGHGAQLYGQLKQLGGWLLDTGREEVYLSIFDEAIGQPLPEQDTQNWCGGTGRMLAFDIDGTIFPCMRYSPLSIGDKQPPLRIGDCSHGIGRLPGDRANLALLEGVTRQSQSSRECLDCPIASGCGWCSAYHYEIYGTPDRRATFICPTHKARVLAASYYHNRRYLETGKGAPFPLCIPRAWAEELVGGGEYEALMALADKAKRKGGGEYGS